MLDGAELARRYSTELLGRVELGEPPELAAGWLAGRRVLITGAGGSVGRPLAAAIAGARPARLVLVDHHEASLWMLQRRLGDAENVSLLPADIRNRGRIAEALRRWEPEIVFHLAAYKHVPFGEVFSDETFAVNVLGTLWLLELSADLHVERFVYPSSDKSCYPPSLYGATKRLCELLVRRAARNTGRVFSVARFVNILGTQGSVIDAFVQQIGECKPLTVTDAAMTRYWIGMSEALWLLLATAAQPRGEQTLMLDAREETAVVEMARRVCLLLKGDAEACATEFATPRPGERLHEELLSASERFEPGPLPGLLRVVDRRAGEHLERLGSLLDRLVGLAEGHPAELREAAMAAARQLQ